MSEHVKVLPLSEHEYAAEIEDASGTTEHRVTFDRAFLDDLLPLEPGGQELVSEAVKYLLQQRPGTALPHDIDLAAQRSSDADFVPEMRARLGA